MSGCHRSGYPPSLQMNHKGKGYNWHYRNTHSNDLLSKTYGEIHHLTEHAPDKIKLRWRQAKIRWLKRMAWWKSGINDRL